MIHIIYLWVSCSGKTTTTALLHSLISCLCTSILKVSSEYWSLKSSPCSPYPLMALIKNSTSDLSTSSSGFKWTPFSNSPNKAPNAMEFSFVYFTMEVSFVLNHSHQPNKEFYHHRKKKTKITKEGYICTIASRKRMSSLLHMIKTKWEKKRYISLGLIRKASLLKKWKRISYVGFKKVGLLYRLKTDIKHPHFKKRH